MKRILIQSILLLFCIYAHTQQAFRNNGNLQIHNGASVAGFSDFTNASSATFVNNGNLYVRGNVINDQAAMSAGTGTLYLNGAVAQSVNGTQKYNSYNLNTNNSAGITLNNNLGVNNLHTFSAGIITTSSTPNYLIYEAGSSYGGDGDSKHVNGWVKKFGSSNFVFPVGNGTVERTIALNSLSVSSEFSVRYFPNTPNPGLVQPPLWNADPSEYWSVQKASGGSATITMNWDNSKVNFPNWIIADIVVAGYNGIVWTDNGGAGTASGNAATTGTVSSGSISSFNLFSFGSRSFILPLTLLNFTATRQNNYTRLQWTTEREYNTDRFIVQRSDNGFSFFAIDEVIARNTNNTDQYSSRDNLPVNSIAYYRLRWNDISGKEYFSQIVTVKEAGADARLTLVANPVRNKITLMPNGNIDGSFNYRIISGNGQLVQQGKLKIESTLQSEIPLINLNAGIYLLEVSDNKQIFNYKITVQ